MSFQDVVPQPDFGTVDAEEEEPVAENAVALAKKR